MSARSVAFRFVLGAAFALAQANAQEHKGQQVVSGGTFSGTVRLGNGTALPPIRVPANTISCTASDTDGLYPVQVVLTPGRLALNGHGNDRLFVICMTGASYTGNAALSHQDPGAR